MPSPTPAAPAAARTQGLQSLGSSAPHASVLPAPPPLPPLSPQDRPLLARLLTLNESYTALAAELATEQWNHLGAGRPKDLVDLYAWSTRPDIAAWISHHRSMTDLQRRTLALDTLQSVIKSTDSATERRRAATTLLRAIDHRWPRECHGSSGSAPARRGASGPPSPRSSRGEDKLAASCGKPGEGCDPPPSPQPSTATPPALESRIMNLESPPPCLPQPRSTPTPSEDPTSALASIREALSTPQPSIALSTLHAHAAHGAPQPATFAGYPIPADKSEWIAQLPKLLPAGFRFPLTLSGSHPLERTDTLLRTNLWLRNTGGDAFCCSLTLIRDGPETPSPCWRLAALDILKRQTG